MMATEEKFIFSDHLSMIQDYTIGGRPLVDLVREIQTIYWWQRLHLYFIAYLYGATSATYREAQKARICRIV